MDGIKIDIEIEIQQSASDQRLYKHLRLTKNDLKVLLISDPSTEKSSVALDVNIGSYSDILGGEAHFLEHMLFMGTKKYPNENEYSSYLSQHGGSSNAYTDLEHTNYYLDVQVDHFQGALDRFAQFFIAPLLKEESLDKERHAVDSEHAKNLQSDMWRTYQLLKSLSRPDHPFSKFGTGNKDSLQAVTHESLLQFYETHYSSNNMALVLLGKESLDVLEEWVERYFSDIPNRHLGKPQFPGEPFSGIAPLSLQVIPVQQAMTLELYFPMPSMEPYYLSKPNRILSHLIGHESKGSLLALLKNDYQWAYELSAGTTRSNSDWSSFGISITLTDSGFDHVNDIVALVFQYIQLLSRDGGIPGWVFDECQTVAECTFRFLSKRNPMDYTSSLATNLHVYPPAHVLSGDYLFYDTSQQERQDQQQCCLKYMIPTNLVLLISHPTAFATTATEQEQWYGVMYSKSTIAPELLEEWSSPFLDGNTKLHLPERNDMIATNFELKHEQQQYDLDGEKKKKNSSEPILLQEPTPSTLVWYKPDTSFSMPKVNVLIQLLGSAHTSSLDNPSNDDHRRLCSLVTAKVMSNMWDDACTNEFAYLASMAGLSCQFSPTKTGLEIMVSGYNDKMKIMMQRMVDCMKALFSLSLSCDEVMVESDANTNSTNATTPSATSSFDRIVGKLKQDLKNFMFAPPYQHAMFGADLIMLEHKWSAQEQLDVLETITLKDVLEYAQDFLFDTCIVECLIHGNVTPLEGKELVHVWTEGLKTSEKDLLLQKDSDSSSSFLASSASLQDRVTHLDGNKKKHVILQFSGFNPDNTNSVLEVVHVLGVLSLQERARLAVLAHILKEPAFHQLRTEQQLGYIVHTALHTMSHHVKGLLILIQSDSHAPQHLEQCVHTFVTDYLRTHLQSLATNEDGENDTSSFQTQVAAVVQNLREAPKNLNQESSLLWDAITKRHYNFKERLEIASLVEQEVTPTELLKFYETHFGSNNDDNNNNNNNNCTPILSVHVYGSNHVEELASTPISDDENTTIVTLETARELKHTLTWYPTAPIVSLEDRAVATE